MIRAGLSTQDRRAAARDSKGLAVGVRGLLRGGRAAHKQSGLSQPKKVYLLSSLPNLVLLNSGKLLTHIPNQFQITR